MIKYLIAFVLFASQCLAGMGIGGFPYPGPGGMVETPAPSYDAGFDLYQSSGDGTPGTNETYILASDTYPTSRGGFTFGYTTAPLRHDSQSAADRRMKGVGLAISGSPGVLKVLLPSAGTYRIWLAAGDTNTDRGPYIKIYDDTTLKATITASVPPYEYMNATGTVIADPFSLYIDIAFSTTAFNISYGESGASASALNHFRIQKL